MKAHALLVLLLLPTLACASFDPAAVGERQRDIERRYSVKVDVEETPGLRGDAMRTLSRIEKSLEVFPDDYRRKMGKINVVETFAGRFGVLASGVGAYTEDEIPEHYREVYIRNKGLIEDVLGVMSDDAGLHVEHESYHSVEYHEVQLLEPLIRPRATGRIESLYDVLTETDAVVANLSPSEVELAASRAPTPHGRDELRGYVWLIKGWMSSHFGDVDGSGTVDDADMTLVDADRRSYDADGDGRLTYADVARQTRYGYLGRKDPPDRGLPSGLAVGAPGVQAPGYVSLYGRKFPFEDRAEVVDRAARWGLVPWLYRAGDETRTRTAWKRFEEIRQADPVAGRKIELMLRYIALHEKPSRLNDRWTRTFCPLGQAMPAATARLKHDPAAQ